MARYGDSYGDITYEAPTPGLIDSLKVTAAKLQAEEIASARGDTVDADDETQAIAYVEQWYRWDRAARCWRPK